ncbi:hypothetical protein M5X00_06690 [Paenibacillus alvei]|uniref:Spo0E like sporulation regulatory protein n=5 Tax=Paenibacillus TaxID=44249 RepID=A0A383RJU0_PAEAL|nr:MULTISPECIES: hypothetical protein [Paenibacillus]EJW19785.1 hypothetical protein PAV_1c07720 [Paenibacillus alvei DSM 29]EPY03951.1 hypothetical protein PAALTS15_27629 [Paenibacillus alvei TS-15]EPY11288.1 hypothetical protein PAAL66ix_18739 [Paenibacillus alvei A6-6i-x]MCY7484526.1 hypothetical protein [Paenibacillus alvei]MCY9531912.1 hypothetical protein [Paenibacillus alvei]
MSYEQMLDRRNELLKRNIQQYIAQDNQHGLNSQEQYLMNHMIKELHQNMHDLHASHK